MAFQVAFPTTPHLPATTALSARIVPLSASRSAVFFDSDWPAPHGRQQLSALLGGRLLDGPIAVTRLALTNGGVRHVFLISQPADRLCRTTLTLSGDHGVLAAIDPLALQSPLTDPAALLAGLDRAGSLRLLKLLLTTGASLFGNGEVGEFGTVFDQLVKRLGQQFALAARIPVGRRAWILSWRLPIGLALPPLDAMTLLANGRSQRVTEFTMAEEVTDGCRLLHLFVDRPIPRDAELLAVGQALLCLGLTGDVAPRPLAGWLVKRTAEVRDQALCFVERLAAAQPDVAILAREIACPPAAQPATRLLHLSQSSAGLLYMIGVDDPRGLLCAVRLDLQRAHVDLPCDRLEWHSSHGAVLVGLVADVPRHVAAATLAPLYHSGRLGDASPMTACQAQMLLPDVFRGLPVGVAAAPLATSLPAMMAARPVWRHRVTSFGPALRAPRIAVVVAAGPALEYLHTVVATVVAEAGGRDVEIVIHHCDGPMTRVVRDTADSLSAVHRISLRIVSAAPQALPSESLRAALQSICAQKVIVLGPGTLPSRRGWLSSWHRRLMTGSVARAVMAEARTSGAGDAQGYIVGLNPAAMSRLLACGPMLPGILTDLCATTGLAVTKANGDDLVSYDDPDPDDLAQAVEKHALTLISEVRHV